MAKIIQHDTQYQMAEIQLQPEQASHSQGIPHHLQEHVQQNATVSL